MELQIVETLALEVAQGAAEVGRLAALVLQMSANVALELVMFGAAGATVHALAEDDLLLVEQVRH